MPPKKVEEPPPPEEDVVEAPQLSPEEALAKAMGMTAKPTDPVVAMLLERSASIQFDPKMKGLKQTLDHHGQEVSASMCDLGSQADLAAPMSPVARTVIGRQVETLRTGGCGFVDRRMKDLEHRPPAALVESRPGLADLQLQMAMQSPPSSPASAVASPKSPTMGEVGKRLTVDEEISRQDANVARLKRFDQSTARYNYRDNTDKTLKKLLIDMDLARDPLRQKHYSNQSRCDHLDKMHTWYNHYSLKEQRKDRKVPPYLLFNGAGPVSPGSMRVQFMTPSPLLAMRKSGSSPALLG